MVDPVFPKLKVRKNLEFIKSSLLYSDLYIEDHYLPEQMEETEIDSPRESWSLNNITSLKGLQKLITTTKDMKDDGH